MVKNDYRRALIMLRTHVQGYSGHVRLERRTLMGSAYISISEPGKEGTLCASLVRRNPRGGYAAVKIGELKRDGRGQATLAYSFDPRNIEGHALEDYWLIAIVHRDRLNRCNVVLSGNLNGSREVDWSAVQTAACAACQSASPTQGAQDVSRPAEPEMMPPIDPLAESGEGPQELPTPELDAQSLPADDLPEESIEETADAHQPTAAETLGLDTQTTWPGVAEQVRSFFDRQAIVQDAPEDEYSYVAAPMPQNSGYDSILIGVQAQDGMPTALSYALPSPFTPEPPPGLEDYVWKGGNASGWWTVEIDPHTGNVIEK